MPPFGSEEESFSSAMFVAPWLSRSSPTAKHHSMLTRTGCQVVIGTYVLSIR